MTCEGRQPIEELKALANEWNELYASEKFEEMKNLATEDVGIANAGASSDPSGLIFGRQAYYDGIVGAYRGATGKEKNLLVMEYETWEYIQLGDAATFFTIRRYTLAGVVGVNCWLLRRDPHDATWRILRVINNLLSRNYGELLVWSFGAPGKPGQGGSDDVTTSGNLNPRLDDLHNTTRSAIGDDLATPVERQRRGLELVHLTSGKNLEKKGPPFAPKPVYGGAYVNGVHSLSHQSGRSKGRGGRYLLNRLDLGTIAHELGHSLGADHPYRDTWCLRRFIICLTVGESLMGSRSRARTLEFSRGERDPLNDNVERIAGHMTWRHLGRLR